MFCDRYGFNPKRIPVKDGLETAQYIAGSKLFVGAASSAKAIAEGLKHPMLMEISKDWPDDLPKGKHGHYHINKEIVEYYLNNDILQATFPEVEMKKKKEVVANIESFFK